MIDFTEIIQNDKDDNYDYDEFVKKCPNAKNINIKETYIFYDDKNKIYNLFVIMEAYFMTFCVHKMKKTIEEFYELNDFNTMYSSDVYIFKSNDIVKKSIECLKT